MRFDKTKVDRILRQLEDIFPNAIADGTKLKVQGTSEVNRLLILLFCEQEAFISARSVTWDAELKDIQDIKITSRGIRFLHNF